MKDRTLRDERVNLGDYDGLTNPWDEVAIAIRKVVAEAALEDSWHILRAQGFLRLGDQ